jgi:uncharacterized protein YdaL
VKSTRGNRAFVGAVLIAIAAIVASLVAAGSASAGARERKPQRPEFDTPPASALVTPQSEAAGNGGPLGGAWRSADAQTWNGWDNSIINTIFGSIVDRLRGGGGGIPNPGTTPPPLGSAAPGAVGSTTLVLYDTTGDYGWLGQLYATAIGNLASHFGTWKAEPVSAYTAGQLSQYTATVYVGSTYDEPVPSAFLDDVYNNSTHPVIWIYDNIWELTGKYSSTFQSKYGWMWSKFDLSSVSHVVYKGVSLTRDGVNNKAGIMGYASIDPTKVTTLATAVRDDGTTFPWAVRSGSLTYIGENPFVYTGEQDRLRIFEDLLYDALNPFAPTRHRVLMRLEDINPAYDPAELKAVADYLYSQHIEYGFGVSPVYVDPNGVMNNGAPQTIKLSDKAGKDVAKMIKYMQARGGTLIMHGYTHQYSNVPNPYNAVTGDDFEFYRTIENADHTLSFLGPVPEDSAAWAASRIDQSNLEFMKAGIAPPSIFEFPHYAGSATDYQVVAQKFSTRWERTLYFGNVLAGGKPDYTHVIGQMVPYLVRDAYGTVVLPENLGNYEPEVFHQFPVHVTSDILAAAKAESVVRDGIAGVYFHPFQGVAPLQQIVDGLRAQGWTFASPTQVAVTG